MIKILENITKEQLEEAVKNSRSYNQVKKAIGLSSSGSAQRSLIKKIQDFDLSIAHFCREYRSYYKKEQLVEAVKGSFCISETLDKLGLNKYGGGNYRQFNKWKNEYQLDTSHFSGKSGNVIIKRKVYELPLADILVKNSTYSNGQSLKRRLFKSGLLKNKCYECELVEWRGKQITIQLEHINGDSSDNRIENLTMLCPNCHSQTSTYCGRKNKILKQTIVGSSIVMIPVSIRHCLCGKKISKNSSQCQDCYHKSTLGISKEYCRKVKNRPSKNSLLKDLKTMGFSAVGRKYGVSDNAIRKWLK